MSRQGITSALNVPWRGVRRNSFDAQPVKAIHLVARGERAAHDGANEHQHDIATSGIAVDSRQSPHLNAQPSLFLDLAHHAGLRCLAVFQPAAGQIPQIEIRAVAEQHALARVADDGENTHAGGWGHAMLLAPPMRQANQADGLYARAGNGR